MLLINGFQNLKMNYFNHYKGHFSISGICPLFLLIYLNRKKKE